MTTAIKPFTCIDDDIIEHMAEIGVYGFAVYAAIKKHRNRETGAWFPSYATIARMKATARPTEAP